MTSDSNKIIFNRIALFGDGVFRAQTVLADALTWVTYLFLTIQLDPLRFIHSAAAELARKTHPQRAD